VPKTPSDPIEENASMPEALRVRLYWEDGTVETARQPIETGVTMIVRQAKDGTHRHFEVTDDRDGDGYVIALELPDES
jgi:hypothetical protein